MQKSINLIFSFMLLALTCLMSDTYGQTVSQGGIVPNGKAYYVDKNGKPLAGGKVFYYQPGGTTPKTTYQDINLTTPNSNPVILDGSGMALVWGTGIYRQVVQDRLNNQIWDTTTSVATGSGGGGPTATGDGDLVGTIKPWAGMSAPNQYVFAFGQELNRTTFSALFTAITSTQGAFCTSGNNILSGLSDTTNFWIGMPVEVSCVPSGFTTITAKTSSTVTMAATANASTNVNATFFPWGRGNGSTTFNVPDYRGLLPVGNNNMGGIASTNISNAIFGSKGANSVGASGGLIGGPSITLLTSNLPPYTPSGTVGTSLNGGTPVNGFTVPGVNVGFGGVNTGGGQIALSVSSSFTGTPQGGTSTPFGVMPPSKTVNYIVKVTPDSNSAIASGVTSLGGMTGDIACGTNLTCTGNVISATPGFIPPTPVRAGDIIYWNGTQWVTLPGNNSGSNFLGESASGVPAWSSQTFVNPNVIDPTSVAFGAKCDGVTHDEVAFQAALNAAVAQRKILQLPAGNCLLNATITNGTSLFEQTAIQGYGQSSQITFLGASQFNFGAQASYYFLRDFQITCTNSATSCLKIGFASGGATSFGSLIENLTIENGVAQVSLQNAVQLIFQNNVLVSNLGSGDGLDVDNTATADVGGNTFTNNFIVCTFTSACNSGVSMTNVGGSQFIGNRMSGYGVDVHWITSISSGASTGLNFENNQLDNWVNFGVLFENQGHGGFQLHVAVTSNVLNNSGPATGGTGIEFTRTGGTGQQFGAVSITGNQVNTFSGIGINVGDTFGFNITGNQMVDSNGTGTTGINVTSDDTNCVVVGNSIQNYTLHVNNPGTVCTVTGNN